MLLGISEQASNKIQHCTLNLPLSFPFKPLCQILFLPCSIPTNTGLSLRCVLGCIQCCLRWRKGWIQPSACNHLSFHASMPFTRTNPEKTTLCQATDTQRLLTESLTQLISTHFVPCSRECQSCFPCQEGPPFATKMAGFIHSKRLIPEMQQQPKKTSLHIHVCEEWSSHFIYGYQKDQAKILASSCWGSRRSWGTKLPGTGKQSKPQQTLLQSQQCYKTREGAGEWKRILLVLVTAEMFLITQSARQKKNLKTTLTTDLETQDSDKNTTVHQTLKFRVHNHQRVPLLALSPQGHENLKDAITHIHKSSTLPITHPGNPHPPPHKKKKTKKSQGQHGHLPGHNTLSPLFYSVSRLSELVLFAARTVECI